MATVRKTCALVPLATARTVASMGMLDGATVWPFGSTSQAPMCTSSWFMNASASPLSDSSTELINELRVVTKEAKHARMTAIAAAATVAVMTRDRKVTDRKSVV